MSLRYYIFLKDVLLLALTAFGGPQAHIAMMFKLLVEKRRYLTDQELIELNALCQILPGPTSTQTITAIGFRIGGPNLAYLTLLVWILPAATIMAIAALVISYLQENNISLHFLRIILPMAVGFVAYAAWKISVKVVTTKVAIALMVVSAVLSYFFRSPWVYPVLLIAGGAVTALRFKQHPQEKDKKLHIQWANFFLYVGVFILAAALGGATSSLPVRLFENFYRNGSMVFGGGQVLVPLMYTEFVQFKGYLTGEEFLSGYAIAQALPGPTFSFTSFVGNLAMREYGIAGQLWKYLQVNKQNFGKIIIAGDFNSNTIWDEWDRWWNHSDVVSELQELGIKSLYHKYFREEQGKESTPTFFLNRKSERPYHIDYMFGSREFGNALSKIEIGNSAEWLMISDHLPLMCEFKQV